MVKQVPIGQRVKALRKLKGWTQRKLGVITGFSHSFIGKIERGKQTVITAPTAKKLAKPMGVRWTTLVTD